MRADARANRHDLVAAASVLLAAHGAGMSLRAVAQAAGVGVATLYRHFPTRRHLLVAVLEHVERRLLAIVDRFLEGETDVAARWADMAEELGREDLLALLAARDALSPEDAPPAELVDAAEQRILSRVAEAVELARRSGLVAEGVTGEQYFAGLLTVTRPLLPSIEARGTVERAWLREVYLNGLRPR